MTNKNKVNISLDYDVLPGTQINLVIVAPGLDQEDDDSPRVGFDLTLKPEEDELDEEDLDEEGDEEDD